MATQKDAERCHFHGVAHLCIVGIFEWLYVLVPIGLMFWPVMTEFSDYDFIIESVYFALSSAMIGACRQVFHV